MNINSSNKMEIAFFTNSLNIHQIAICDELYNLTNCQFKLIETKGLSEERKKMGFRDFERPYVIKSYVSTENFVKATKIAINADVAIMGANSFIFLKKRINNTAKLTFTFSERWFKKGIVNVFSPRFLEFMLLYYMKGKKRPWYILCASAYLSSDFNLINAFINRCYKWGYFPNIKQDDINYILLMKQKTAKIKILWVGRFLKWKHPEEMIYLAHYLKKNNYDFEINMVGNGVLFNKIHDMINRFNLNDKIKLLGNLPNSKVMNLFQSHHIFCFTSDRKEGWGVVLNEAMANACAVVSSVSIGSTPYLIENYKNGLIFNLTCKGDLINKVEQLINNDQLRTKLSQGAYDTIHNMWNAHIAAKRFLQLIISIQNGDRFVFKDNGPCSIAEIIYCNKKALLPCFYKSEC